MIYIFDLSQMIEAKPLRIENCFLYRLTLDIIFLLQVGGGPKF